LEATWRKLKAVMQPGRVDLRTKEIIALAVSITNNCEY
jgi:alkylhydroperoxidase/carboxymuconolactone decarboxylase family protein YurZ